MSNKIRLGWWKTKAQINDQNGECGEGFRGSVEAKKAWTTPPAREQCEPTFDFSPEHDRSTPYLGHIHKSESSQVYIRKYKVLTLSIANIFVCPHF
jgi:hypothetical protein